MFLRELISNAADALDKRRFLALQDPGQEGDVEYEITINADPESRMLRIRDTGVGMNETELRTNLGVIAKSGTAAFLENLSKEGGTSGVSQIGQFGTLLVSCMVLGIREQILWSEMRGALSHIFSRADVEFLSRCGLLLCLLGV